MDDIEFTVVWGTNLENFTKDVNEALRDGWYLRGDFIVRTGTDPAFYYQAMIRQRPQDIPKALSDKQINKMLGID